MNQEVLTDADKGILNKYKKQFFTSASILDQTISMDINLNKQKRKQYLQNIEMEKFLEATIEQMNALRMGGTNLVSDMDEFVNDYLSICKKYPIK